LLVLFEFQSAPEAAALVTATPSTPARVTTEPARVTTEPARVTTGPASVATEPASGTTEPASGTTEPASGGDAGVSGGVAPLTSHIDGSGLPAESGVAAAPSVNVVALALPVDSLVYSRLTTTRSGFDADAAQLEDEDDLFPELRDDPDAMPALEQMPSPGALPGPEGVPERETRPPLGPLPGRDAAPSLSPAQAEGPVRVRQHVEEARAVIAVTPEGSTPGPVSEPAPRVDPARAPERVSDPPGSAEALALCLTPLLSVVGLTRERLEAGFRTWQKLRGYHLRDC
jgi:hypothetical protein